MPKTTRQLLEEFDATHTSINSTPNGAEAGQQLANPDNNSPGPAHKRQRLLPTQFPAHLEGEPKPLNIMCRSWQGDEVLFRVKPTTKLDKLMDAYCHHCGAIRTGYSFLFDGSRLCLDDTPEGLQMEDWDIIEVFQVQCGD